VQRPTIHDVAEAAQVSLATVDRVLNKRGGVAAKSIEKVSNAVARTGYVRDISAANLSRRRRYRLAFVLPDGDTSFLRLLRAALSAERDRLAAERVEIEERTSATFDPGAQAVALRAIHPAGVDAVAVIASETPEIRAEIARLRSEGVTVLTLVSDMPGSGRDAYVGVDNVAAGRTAAHFMGRFVGRAGGRVLMVAGSLAARDHMERVMGFRAALRERFAGIEPLAAVEGFDDAARVEALVRTAMAEGPLAGVYAIGAGTRGLIAALDGMAAPARPVTIVHDLTERSRAALMDGTIDLVLDQAPGAQVSAAVTIMRALADGGPVPDGAGATTFNVFVRENVR